MSRISTEMFDEMFALTEVQLLEVYKEDDDAKRRDAASGVLLGRIRTGLRKDPCVEENELPQELAEELLGSLQDG